MTNYSLQIQETEPEGMTTTHKLWPVLTNLLLYLSLLISPCLLFYEYSQGMYDLLASVLQSCKDRQIAKYKPAAKQ